MKKENLKAILFDFDGTLADTMEDNFLAWKKAFQDYGIKIQREDYFLLEGMNLLGIAKTLGERSGLDERIFPEIVNLKNKYYLKNNKFRFYTGAVKIIKEIKKKKLIALVSGSPREKLEKTVPREFLDNFNTIVSGDDTVNGKPHPEPYLIAMKKLNLNPEECIVVENAPLGIKSAKSAGVYCIAITTTLDKEYLREADRIIKNHEELREIIIL